MRDRFNEVENFIHLLHSALRRRTILKMSRNDGDLLSGKIRHIDGCNQVTAASAAHLTYDLFSEDKACAFTFSGFHFPILLLAVIPVISLVLKGHELYIPKWVA